MNDVELSIIIPARNEMFLKRTIEDILEHREARTEIIVVLDGALADPPINAHPDVKVIYHAQAVGQRAASNEAARLARGKYIMKCDAHCSFDQGFDRKMIEAFQGHDNWTMVPVMRNLHAFDWVCPDGHRRYQGPSGPCLEKVGGVVCGKPTERDICWIAKDSPQSKSYCFDSEPHFQYFKEFNKRPEGKGDITPTMSLQGSCFMLTKERYFALNICDEEFGSWGSQGIEVAVKTWLSGGEVMVNQKTWYAHLFRTQGGDFSFPYPQSGKQVSHAKKTAKQLFFNNKWPLQEKPLYWLLEKFWPVPGWTEKDLENLKKGNIEAIVAPALKKADKKSPKKKKLSKGVVYYTHDVGDPKILEACREQIAKGIKEKHIISVSSKPLNFGTNFVREKQDTDTGWVDMFEKILKGLEKSTADVIFFCEHDVLYHPSHFDFVPPKKDVFYYNTNVVKVRYEDGFTLKVDDCKQLSGLCADRKLLIKHYKERLKRVKEEGFTRGNGFEPGTRNLKNGGYDDFPAEAYQSKYPNIDIRHGSNSTQNRWRKDQFRNKKYTAGWKEGHISKIEGWEELPDIFNF